MPYSDAIKALDALSTLDWIRQCNCSHVYWAHWANGQCAHCYCISLEAVEYWNLSKKAAEAWSEV